VDWIALFIVAESKLWDGRFWNMRCEIRERLVDYLQKAHPWALPRIRTGRIETAAAVA
jgi:hypothetical protein